ncbi:hypothetical protein [Cupriavidus campinensis]
MKPAFLDYARAPRAAVVFGCLLPAPWMGVATGLLLAVGPSSGLPDRFAPLTLALVHALALGMLLPVMLGALFQMMPVVAHVDVRGMKRVAPWVAAVAAGTALALGVGFVDGSRAGFRAATLGGAPFLLAVGGLLWMSGRRVGRQDATTRTLAGVGGALCVAVACGGMLAGLLGGLWSAPMPLWLALHVSWGLGGWLGTLVMGVSMTVLPMFWQAPRPPRWAERAVPTVPWALLVLDGAVRVAWPALAPYAALPWLAAMFVLAVTALAGMLRARRRHDPAWVLWVVAWASGAMAALLAALAPAQGGTWPLAWWIGTLALVGGGVLPVTAMLGKIVPFLVWLQLRRLLPPRTRVPTMQQVIAPRRQRAQALLLLAAYAQCLALPLAPTWLAATAGLTFAAANAWLGWQLLSALRCLRRVIRQGGLPPRARWIGEDSGP